MNRRQFLSKITRAAATVPFAASASLRAQSGRPGRILLRSSWQSVNIGDIGHTPGALSLLWKYLPDLDISLWPGNLGHGTREFLSAAYPRLKIVEGSLGKDGKPTTPALAQAWDSADLYLSGSGSGFPASHHALAFRKATGKPLGVFGVSADPVSGFGEGCDPEGGTLLKLRERALLLPPNHLAADLRYTIDNAAFFFCRDTITRDYLKAQEVRTPLVEFGPDAQLGMPLRDDAKGFAWLKEHGLEEGKFICVIPRLRYTPYHKIHKTVPKEVDLAKEALNARTTEQDHAKLREMLIAYIKATGNKVLVCAEMTYQVDMGKEVLLDPLPEELKHKVVWRDSYWLPDEAASIYSKAQCVVSLECHSPLIALHQGTPTFYVRQPTDTCKGQMYRDFGAADWLFEVDETSGPQLWSALSVVAKDPAAARAKARAIMANVEREQKRMVETVGRVCRALP